MRSSPISSLTIVREATRHNADARHRLRSVPGIGKVLAVTILYTIPDITRCGRVQEFASYARLIKCAKESGGKTLGTGGAKMGNVHLKWAFSEAAVTFLRHNPEGQKLVARLEKKHGKGKALSILAHKIGRAAYYMLVRGTMFSMDKFLPATTISRSRLMPPLPRAWGQRTHHWSRRPSCGGRYEGTTERLGRERRRSHPADRANSAARENEFPNGGPRYTRSPRLQRRPRAKESTQPHVARALPRIPVPGEPTRQSRTDRLEAIPEGGRPRAAAT